MVNVATKKEIIDVLCRVGYELATTGQTFSPIGRARYDRASNPQVGDLVIETLTGGGRMQGNYSIAVGFYVKREKIEMRHRAPDEDDTYFEDVATIRTFDGKEVTWENCRFVTILPHEGWEAVKVETRHHI